MSLCFNCHSKDISFVYQQNNVISYQNVLLSSKKDALNVPRGRLTLYFCHQCSFLFNLDFDQNLVGYGEHYENAQNHSSIFENHIDSLIRRILYEKKIIHHKILEVGCGNGYFLKKLIADENDNIGFGYDKSLPNVLQEKRFQLINKYYDENDENDFDVILSRHVVEHILENNPLLSLLIRKNPQALFLLETPSLEWIIKNQAYYDIFYEHCSYFSKASLEILFQNHGMGAQINNVFNGQYLWLESTAKVQKNQTHNKLNFSMIKDFFCALEKAFTSYSEMIEKTLKYKKIAVWGAGAKGVTFVNLVDPMREKIAVVIDINPRKCGKFLPGAAHPIASPSILWEEDFDAIIIMNPNYKNEIMNLALNKKYDFICV